jgi:[ribosomal protein S5]-alanine N-acetyltransferase
VIPDIHVIDELLPLRTRRCLLRRSSPADAAWVAAAVGDPRFPHNDSWSDVESEEAARLRLEIQSARWESVAALHFSIECLPGRAGAGQVSISREPEPDTWLLGYWIVPDKWGQGFATECASAVLELAVGVLGAQSVWAGTAPSNQASRRVLSKLGFEFRNENPCGYMVGATEVPTHEYEFVVDPSDPLPTTATR